MSKCSCIPINIYKNRGHPGLTHKLYFADPYSRSKFQPTENTGNRKYLNDIIEIRSSDLGLKLPSTTNKS